jgi:hypothetical protein
MRVYRIKKSGRVVPSVTTALGAMISKPILMKWAVKETCNYLYEKLKEKPSWANREVWSMFTDAKKASDRIAKNSMYIGTEVHKLIEDFLLKGNNPNLRTKKDEVKNAFLAFFKWYKFYEPEVLGVEIPLFYDDEFGYAGTTDLIAKVDNIEMMLDFKTSNHIFLPDYALQLALYRFTDEAGVKDTACLRLDKVTAEYEYELFGSRYEDDRDAGLAMIKAYHLLNKDEIQNGKVYKEI